MLKKFMLVAALVAMPLVSAMPSLAADDNTDFTIKNGTGAEVKAIYTKITGAADNDKNWDVIGEGKDIVWAKDEESPVELASPKYDKECEIDLKVVTKNGDEWTCGPVTLCDKDGNFSKRKIRVWMEKGTLMWENEAHK